MNPEHSLSMLAASETVKAAVEGKEIELRDRFAAAALTGMLTNPETAGSIAANASDAYVYADAMLAARKGRGT